MREGGIPVERRKLDPCDYIVNGVICIERKTLKDFLKSVYDGRLFDQIRRMVEARGGGLVMVEVPLPSLSERERKVVVGAAAKSIVSGVPIVCIPEGTGPRFLEALARLEPVGSLLPAARIRRRVNPKERRVAVLEAFPGIGPRLAERLLERFGSLERVFAAGIPELREVIGDKRAREFKALLREVGEKRGEERGLPI